MKKLIAIVQPFGLALVLAAGFSGVYAVIVMIGLSMVDNAIQPRERIRTVYVDSNGTPVIWEWEPGGLVALKYLSSEGAEIQDTPDIQPNQILLFPPNQRSLVTLGANWRTRNIGLERPVTRWYLVYEGKEHGEAYFEGFDPESKLRAGFIGARGFRIDEPPLVERFNIDGTSWPVGPAYLAINQPNRVDGWEFADLYLISGKDLLAIDFRGRTVRRVLSADNMLSLGLLSPPVRRLPNGTEQKVDPDAVPLLAIREADRILLLDAKGAEQGSYVIPEALRRDDLDFYQKENRGLAIVSRVRPAVDDLYWFDREGHILKQAQVVRSTHDSIFERPGLHGWLVALGMPYLVGSVFEPTIASTSERKTADAALSWTATISQAIGENWPSLAMLAVVSGVLAWLAARRQRAYSQRGTVGWAIFVVLFGLPGFVGYLVHRRWPVRAACPSCGHLAPRDRETCAHCGKEFLRPIPKGIEVIAA